MRNLKFFKIKGSLLLLVCFLTVNYGFSQVGIGTSNPNSSSILDISSSNKGVLFPRMDLATAPIDSPVEGLVVWNTDLANEGANAGLFYWNGSAWVSLISNDKLDSQIQSIQSSSSGGASGVDVWQKGGNEAADGDFMGTTNYKPLELRVDNQRMLYLDPHGGMSMGKNANANLNRSIAIGEGAQSVPVEAMAVGVQSKASAYQSMALGVLSESSANEGIAVGVQSNASGYRSVAIGSLSTSSNNDAVALGIESSASGQKSTALGSNSNASGQNSVAIGYNSSATNPNTIILGNNVNSGGNATKVGIGTSNPSEKLEVNGSIKITDGTQGAGKVLTSDANGKASWVDPTTVKYFAEIRKTSSSVLTDYNRISFGATDFSQGVTVNNDFIKVQNAGIYRVKYKLTIKKYDTTLFGSYYTNVGFYISKGYNTSGKVSGSESYVKIYENEKVTVSGEKIIQLNANEAISIFSDTTDNTIGVLAEGTTLNIEKIN